MNLDLILEDCINLAVDAGKAILDVYKRDFSVEYKDDKSPLTEADQLSNDIIVKGLSEKHPSISILSEEFQGDETRFDNDYCFIVDPLDGTKEFIKKNDEFTVNIALSHKGKPIIGVVYVPVTNELYYGLKDSGAFYRNLNELKPIRVSDKVNELILMGSRSHQSEKFKNMVEKNKDKITEIRSAGSSLKGCLVAKGEADIYYRFGLTMEWDTAAMHCIVEESGGVFRQIDHSEMTYNRKDSLNSKGFYVLNKTDNLFVE